MGTEYYIIKPKRKEMFYLGKDIWYNLEGISQRIADFVQWEDWEDVLCDIIRARCWSGDDNMEYMSEIASEIWEFVEYEEVRLANDCEDNTDWLSEYKETKDITEICRQIYGDA